MRRAFRQRDLVVGGVDRVDHFDAVGEVERPGRVQQLGLDPAAQAHLGVVAQAGDREARANGKGGRKRRWYNNCDKIEGSNYDGFERDLSSIQ